MSIVYQFDLIIIVFVLVLPMNKTNTIIISYKKQSNNKYYSGYLLVYWFA